MKLMKWAGFFVVALAAGCAPGGGGGGDTGAGQRPLVIEVEGFDEWFEIRDDGAWPTCDEGVDVEVMDFDDNITRLCAGTEHFARTEKGTGVIYQWRYEFEPGQHWRRAIGERGTGLTLKIEEVSGPTECEAQCWGAGCNNIVSNCREAVERFDVDDQPAE